MNSIRLILPGILVLAREVRKGGRNICRVNGRTVTLAVLNEVSQGLIDSSEMLVELVVGGVDPIEMVSSFRQILFGLQEQAADYQQ